MILTSNVIRIDPDSRVPKYQQIVNSITENIEKDIYIIGEKIPSINEISEDLYLSRDTVEKAYNLLKKKKIIVSVKGKGYYVAKNVSHKQLRVLFLINKLSNYKLQIYNSFISSLGSDASIELKVYHCDANLLCNLIQENMAAYDYYVVMPHFKDKDNNHQNADQRVITVLNEIPKDKLILMDNLLPSLQEGVAAIYQDFKSDIYDSLEEGIDKLRKYEKIIFVYPDQAVYPYPKELKMGFVQFCRTNNLAFEVISTIYPDMEFDSKDAYITIEENDLVSLVEQTRDKDLEIGKDIGIISYNDSPLKKLLRITVLSTNFQAMGETAAFMIKRKKSDVVRNVFNFIDRGSV
ncbi:GntR family transcriptional regulator [Belliella sp. DSM 111904]|uniref:GntR family transcriptional regulator n=1 Tax=Belliella filtrata TaxID=2923435 RepID=A0ABS9UVC2_9BACT|nr:GntR family transcriptional regulator [Belliella filtrata]MCH7408127.1 GntR family transcriptional regulator [Belliella filtrata]